MTKLTGLIAATFTPMNQAAQIDVAPIPAIVEKLLEQGIRGLYVCGSTGEGPSLTLEERSAVAEAYIKAVRGRVPVVVQVGHNAIHDARKLAEHAAASGADAISAVPPSYFIPEDVNTLVDTLAFITDGAPMLPFYYYHIPRLSGISLNLIAFLEQARARIPTLAGIKFSSREIEIMQQCLAYDNERYNILFGVDEMLLSGVAAGCHGAVGSTYNFLAPLYHQVLAHLHAGDLAAAQACQRTAADLIAVIIKYHGISGLKAAMSLTGVDCGRTRLPLTLLSDGEHKQLRMELEALDFFSYTTVGKE